MANYIDNYAESVRQILSEGVREANDFTSLAIAGEQLRRASSVADVSTDAANALKEYETFLASYSGHGPGELAEIVEDSLAGLQDYASASTRARDVARGKELLVELDELMSVCVAGARAKLYSPRSPVELGALAQTRVSSIAGALSALAQFAEDREILFGPDSEYPEAFAWWDGVAELAPSRVTFRSTVNAVARKERVLQSAIANFEAKHQASALSSLAESVKAGFARLADGLRLAMPAPAFDFADDAKLPSRQHELFEEGAFTVLADLEHLVFVVTEDHALEPVSVRLSGKALNSEALDSASFRVALPSNAGSLEVVIRIDGEELVLPPIDYRERS